MAAHRERSAKKLQTTQGFYTASKEPLTQPKTHLELLPDSLNLLLQVANFNQGVKQCIRFRRVQVSGGVTVHRALPHALRTMLLP